MSKKSLINCRARWPLTHASGQGLCTDHIQTERERDRHMLHIYIYIHIYNIHIIYLDIVSYTRYIVFSVAKQLYSPTRLYIWFIGDNAVSISDNTAIKLYSTRGS